MAIFPLRDENPVQVITFQYVTVGIIASCVLVFLAQTAAADGLVTRYALVPAALFGLSPSELPPVLTLITSAWLHGGLWHLLGNMFYLWLFGDNVEDSMGHARFIIFYLICAVASALIHAVSDPSSAIPTLGASGAISGVMGAYLVLHPRVRILCLFLGRFFMHLPAYAVIGMWFAFQILSAVATSGATGGGIAWWAHIGGFAVGAVLIFFIKKPGQEIFDRGATVTLGDVRRHPHSYIPQSRRRAR